jgi:hypothetical protein
MASVSWQPFLSKLHVRAQMRIFRQKLWPKTVVVYFLTTFYVEIPRIPRATHVPNVTEWHGLGWTTPTSHFNAELTRTKIVSHVTLQRVALLECFQVGGDALFQLAVLCFVGCMTMSAMMSNDGFMDWFKWSWWQHQGSCNV